jgi:rSAM/selenodomain-associated transferase 2
VARISVVVPVVDEADRIAADLQELARHDFDEIIVVDGGSCDDTVERARPYATLVLQSRCGRGRQMARGARYATGSVLLFLHLDCKLPARAADTIREVMAQPDVVGGAFRTRHVLDDARSSWIRPVLPMADLRSTYTRLPYGDQALFVKADAYQRAGGFSHRPLFEDVDLARRLWKLGRIEIVPDRVEVSARRYAARPLRTALMMNLFPTLWRLGISEERLLRWYGRVR